MSTDDFLYDGSGSRVEQKSVVSGTTSDTLYLMGGVEEVTGGVVTKYLGVAGLPTAIRVGTTGALNYLASDGLGSVSEALDGAGNVVATQLYTPYGQTRYSSGAMPTSKGFTGQRADVATDDACSASGHRSVCNAHEHGAGAQSCHSPCRQHTPKPNERAWGVVSAGR